MDENILKMFLTKVVLLTLLRNSSICQTLVQMLSQLSKQFYVEHCFASSQHAISLNNYYYLFFTYSGKYVCVYFLKANNTHIMYLALKIKHKAKTCVF